MIFFVAYSHARQMHSHAPHNYQQLVRICNRDPTLMATYYEPDKNQIFSKTIKKGLITFTTSCHMFLLNIWNLTSNWSHVSLPSTKGFGWNSMAKIELIIVTKASNNNQCPLDWFNTHVDTTRFKHVVIASTMAHTWAFRTHYYKLNVFCLP